ncbi:MAG: MBL fold metallo-hydrolase [Gemmatimonadaceae bacterium]
MLLDGGYPGTAPIIMASIAKLGFDIRDVKVLLNSEPPYDHAGGLPELQKASGAATWESDASADALSSGGYDRNVRLPLRLVPLVIRYADMHVNHRIKDGDTI